MSDFEAWFKQREGVIPPACQWFRTFMTSDDATEVERLFTQHQAILVTDEMVEEMEGTIRIMNRRIEQLRAENPLMVHFPALNAIQKTRDRLLLIAETRQYGVAEAIRRHKQKHTS